MSEDTENMGKGEQISAFGNSESMDLDTSDLGPTGIELDAYWEEKEANTQTYGEGWSSITPETTTARSSTSWLPRKRSHRKKVDWEPVKEPIRALYMEKGYSLATVMEIMAKEPYNFSAS